MKISTIFYFILLVLVIIMIAMGSIFLYAKYQLDQYIVNDLSEKELALVEKLLNEPVNFPEDWSEKITFSPELISSASEVRDFFLNENSTFLMDWGRVYFFQGPWDVFLQEKTLLNIKMNRANAFFEKFSSEIEAIGNLFKQPDFNPSAFRRDSSYIDYLKWNRAITDFFCLKAYSESLSQNWEDSFETLIILLQANKNTLSSSLIESVISSEAGKGGLHFLLPIIQSCSDEVVLESCLLELNRLENKIHPSLSIPEYFLCNHLDGLRDLKEKGVQVDMSPGKPVVFYAKQLFKHGGSMFNLPFNTPFVSQYCLEIWVEAEVRARSNTIRLLQTNHVNFNLIQLGVVNQILSIRGEKIKTNPEDFIPDFFPEPLLDPFSNEPYLWDSVKKVFYSVGPDGVDDHNQPLIKLYPDIPRGDITLILDASPTL